MSVAVIQESLECSGQALRLVNERNGSVRERFRTRRALIELTSHLDGHSESLQHLIRSDTDEVQSNDLLLGSLDDELEGGRLLVFGVHHRVVERGEGGLVDLDLVVTELLASLRLSLWEKVQS